MKGLGFFFLTGVEVSFSLDSRVNEKPEPMVRERVKVPPWDVSSWQNSRNLSTRVKSLALILHTHDEAIGDGQGDQNWSGHHDFNYSELPPWQSGMVWSTNIA